jgi:hypothetical protein
VARDESDLEAKVDVGAGPNSLLEANVVLVCSLRCFGSQFVIVRGFGVDLQSVVDSDSVCNR